MANNMKWWEWLIPFWPAAKTIGSVVGGTAKLISNAANDEPNFDANYTTDTYNNHGLDESGNIDINPADPTSSAANVINYDPNKSAQENLLGYAQANNSASAYESYLANQYQTEMSNTALSRAIADAEANGISKYQLFQSGNMAASTPASAVGTSTSYENAMDRRNQWNAKELEIVAKTVTSLVSSALGVVGKIAK